MTIPNPVEREQYLIGLGRRIRAARITTGLSAHDVGKKIGFGGVAIASWERADRRPPVDILPSLAAVLDVPLASLLVDVNHDKDGYALGYHSGWTDCATAGTRGVRGRPRQRQLGR